ncbi:SLOG family protein [Paenibacillus dendritiformis]|uniref:SLOG family protein n=1 Tax=Paenibacillus dendritiformis TaxID=130049 RepID=UPI00387E1AA6
MVDFRKLNSPEWKQRMKERQEQRKLEEQIRKQTACFTGHRPDKLGGYDMKNPTMLKLRDKLLEIIEILINEEGVNHFISGGALGTDQCAFWCVHMIKKKYPEIKNIVAIPFLNQDKIWTAEQKHWYKKMLSLADEVVNVEVAAGYKADKDTTFGEFSRIKMNKRNEYMVDRSNTLIAVYDGSFKGGTANCVRYARRNQMGMMYIEIMPQYDYIHEVRWF